MEHNHTISKDKHSFTHGVTMGMIVSRLLEEKAKIKNCLQRRGITKELVIEKCEDFLRASIETLIINGPSKQKPAIKIPFSRYGTEKDAISMCEFLGENYNQIVSYANKMYQLALEYGSYMDDEFLKEGAE